MSTAVDVLMAGPAGPAPAAELAAFGTRFRITATRCTVSPRPSP
ncbi:MAG TPA: hypothetical protein VGR06_25005 [Actinophytocola sp.]|nr:hypothetical protein [Actinophytocola sp.]